ncbi:hepatocyte growth factor-like protein [Poeciliopsis prolifica]|uniref:hepatocyte growth factor-like protein n=1 Tax=Poeciliopsis prolifica TaxID=188132 RepID=UPI0024139ECC|nr:hepatocyte growth factor-like protein [Poeciliopsis prolifica]
MDLYKVAFLLGAFICTGLEAQFVIYPGGNQYLTCITGNGAAYRGTVGVTASGRTCQEWAAQTPHHSDISPLMYPYAGLDKNYCRNPNNGVTPLTLLYVGSTATCRSATGSSLQGSVCTATVKTTEDLFPGHKMVSPASAGTHNILTSIGQKKVMEVKLWKGTSAGIPIKMLRRGATPQIQPKDGIIATSPAAHHHLPPLSILR